MRLARPTHSHSWAKIGLALEGEELLGRVDLGRHRHAVERVRGRRVERREQVLGQHRHRDTSLSRSRNLRILPTLVRGSSSTSVISRAAWTWSAAPRTTGAARRPSADPPGRPHDEADRHLVAHVIGHADHRRFEHAGCSASTCSTSTVDTFSPATFSTSLRRPVEEEAAGGVAPGAVAGQEPAVAERRRRSSPGRRGSRRTASRRARRPRRSRRSHRARSACRRALHLHVAARRDVAHRRGDRVSRLIGQHGRDGLRHPVELAGPAAEQRGERLVLVVGDVDGVPAVLELDLGLRTGRPARIIRIGAANRLACVAWWRCACSRNPLAENVCIKATDAPPRSPARSCSTARWRGTAAARRVGGAAPPDWRPRAIVAPAKA